MVLALPCRLNPSWRSRSPTVSAEPLWRWRVSSAASVRVDIVVQRSGDIGSPRSCGSTRASSAGRSPGSRSAARLRPPPSRRARPSSSAPESSSSTPSDTVASRTPAARATSRIPPCPSARASAPISSRRCRSSRCGKITSNFAASISSVTSITPIAHQRAGFQEATAYFPASPYPPRPGSSAWPIWLAGSDCRFRPLRGLTGGRSMEHTATMPAAPMRTVQHESVAVRTRRLAAARRRATAVLAGVTVLFIAVSVAGAHGAFLGYVPAGAEASMVRGVADWFAVTALFRHPLGLPIPYTALVVERKDQFAATLGQFVQENFLNADVLAERIRSARLVPRLAACLADEANAARFAGRAADLVVTVAETLRDEGVQRVLTAELARAIDAVEVAPLAGPALRGISAGADHP